MTEEFKDFCVYILRTPRGTLYTGQTNNLERRLKEHNSHGRQSAKYTRAFGGGVVVYQEHFPTRGEALRREAAIKKLTKKEKEIMIQVSVWS